MSNDHPLARGGVRWQGDRSSRSSKSTTRSHTIALTTQSHCRCCGRLSVWYRRSVDEAFVRAVADWQEDNIGPERATGRSVRRPRLTSIFNIRKPLRLFSGPWRSRRRGKFCSTPGATTFGTTTTTASSMTAMRSPAMVHIFGTYPSFAVVAGTYTGLGWGRNKTLSVPRSMTMQGPFQYRVCADVVSRAYNEARVMPAVRVTATILQSFREKGYVWRRSEGYPTEYLPGDFICTLDKGVGHSGIVVTRAATTTVPSVVELPGPSTQVDLGTYERRRTTYALGPDQSRSSSRP